MWKSGPEWAAQQAKLASDRIQNTGVFSACPSVMSARTTPLADVLAAGGVIGRGCRAKQHRRRQDNAPGDDAERKHGEAPVVRDDQPARERRHQRRAQCQTSRDKRHREASMADEPAGGGSGQWDIYSAGGKTGGGTVNGQKHRKTLRLACCDEADSLQ